LIHQIMSTKCLQIHNKICWYISIKNPWQNTGKCTCNLTTNWQQKRSKPCVALSDVSATQDLLDFYCQFVVKQYVMQNLLGFCCQFAVTLCTQALLTKHKLIADTDGTGFVTNLWTSLMPIWRQFASNLFTGKYIVII